MSNKKINIIFLKNLLIQQTSAVCFLPVDIFLIATTSLVSELRA